MELGRMKSWAWLFLSGLFLASLFVAEASAEETLTMVYMTDAAPCNWVEDGVVKGIEPEIVQYVCDRLGIKVVHEFSPWLRAKERVRSGQAEAMPTTPTVERFKYAGFGKENLLPNYWNLFIRKGDTAMAAKVKTFTRLEDLKPYRLVDFAGNGWSAAFMKKENGYNIRYVTRIEQLPVMLALGRTDILINSSSWINWWAEKKGVADRIAEYDVDWPWTRFHFVFMVSRRSPWVKKGLVRAFDREIRKMKEEGVWQAILRKYKNPHGLGKPFTSTLDAEYEQQGGFYTDYDKYPVYRRAE